MRYRSLDINLLVMLDILLETGSITRTSETLGLTQPAVSAALARLRSHFGDDLLVPFGRANTPTPLARRLKTPLKELLARTDALIAMRPGFDPASDKRRFSLIGSEYVGIVFGNDLLKAVALAGPHLTVELDTIQPASFDRFERGEIEMMIIPEQIALPDHPTMRLIDESWVCAVSADNSEVGDALTLEQYFAARHVVFKVHGSSRLAILDGSFLDRSAYHREVAVEVPGFAYLLEFLPGTPFIATIQRRLAMKLSERLPIRIVEAPIEFPPLPIVMQWHRHLDDDDGLKWFRSRVKSAASALMLPAASEDKAA